MSSVYGRGNAVMRSVWPRYLTGDSFSSFLLRPSRVQSIAISVSVSKCLSACISQRTDRHTDTQITILAPPYRGQSKQTDKPLSQMYLTLHLGYRRSCREVICLSLSLKCSRVFECSWQDVTINEWGMLGVVGDSVDAAQGGDAEARCDEQRFPHWRLSTWTWSGQAIRGRRRRRWVRSLFRGELRFPVLQ